MGTVAQITERLRNRFLEAALNYAKRDLPVFPCRSDKKPYTSGGFKDATTDPEQIRAWWTKWPDAMIGMPTGTASGVLAIDVDVAKVDGESSLRDLASTLGPLPDTVTSETPSGGRHLHFSMPKGNDVRNSASKLGPGIDVRGNGGYVIVAPSSNAVGRYAEVIWDRLDSPARLPMRWLEAIVDGAPYKKHTDSRVVPGPRLKPRPNARPEPKGKISIFPRPRLKLKNVDDLPITQGNRNDTLYRLACGKVRKDAIGSEALYKWLSEVNQTRCQPPLDGEELRGIVESALNHADTRPVVKMREGALHEVVDAIEAIAGEHRNIYARSNELVRVVNAAAAGLRVRQDESEAERRFPDPAQPVIQSYTGAALQVELSRIARFKRLGKKGWADSDPQMKYVNGLLGLGEWQHIRRLLRFATLPILRLNGSVHQVPGYDPETGLLLISGGFPEIPKHPTKADADAAMKQLYQPFKEFPFVNAASLSVALGAVLCGVARHLLARVPYFHIDAPKQGSGKTLLADTIGMIIMGTVPAHMPFPLEQEEMRKKLTSCCLRGDHVIMFDNVPRGWKINDPVLANFITAEVLSDRRLGVSEQLSLPQMSLVISTGNNNSFVGDMPRRTWKSRIDADMEHPEARAFGFNPLTYATAHRPELVVAALCVLSAYIQAGRPEGKSLTPMGGFEDCNLVRGAMVWLGLDDPLLTQAELFEDDQQAEDGVELVEAVWMAMGDGIPFTVSELMQEANLDHPIRVTELAVALQGIPRARNQELNRHVIGSYFRTRKDQVIGGYKIKKHQRSKQSSRVATWVIEKVRPLNIRN